MSQMSQINLYQQLTGATATRITLPGFRLTNGLITLISDNHVDNYLKENLAFVIFDSIVND